VYVHLRNVFALGFCSFLTYKGLNFPSTPDAGTNGNVIVDFFWGTELYPRIFGWDVKQFTNCRFGMMFWQVALICFAFKQYDEQKYLSSSLFASVIIQSVYIAKFFLWETGYFKTMDIQHDRAGYYICWGCLVWVPSMYTIHSHYMVSHPVNLSAPMFILVVGLGVFCTWCNYDCDKQRQEFREADGKIKIWGKNPEFVVAHYKTADGETRSSLLLADGWWAISRHFHYVPEIAASYFWCLPFVFDDFLPNFYPLYLTALLVDRAWRDDARCAAKYKDDWDQYCKKVPYKIIPGIV
jgi:7-dehydrocholesterol reductase